MVIVPGLAIAIRSGSYPVHTVALYVASYGLLFEAM